MSCGEFACQYPRNEQGWLKLPPDVKLRKALFPDKVFEHPAKMHLHLLQALIEHLTVEGETLLDPFAGTGSLLIAARQGRLVELVELEERFLELIQEAIGLLPADQSHLARMHPGDCRKVLPIPCDHAITSPPYSNLLKARVRFVGGSVGRSLTQEATEGYSGELASKLNLGLLNTFYFGHAMNKVYSLLFSSIRPGGSLTVVLKDQSSGGQRIFLSEACIKACTQSGFAFTEWYKVAQVGTATKRLMRGKGAKTIDDEDILIFRR